MEEKIIKRWLYLTLKTKITRTKLISLYKLFGSSENIFGASKDKLLKTGLLLEEDIEAIKNANFSQIEEYMGILSINKVRVLTVESANYPEGLYSLSNMPPVLYCRGKFIDLNKVLCIASVGTRNPSPYGKRMTYSIARGLCEKGFVIVSGMAQGVDAISHKAAIDAGAPTVAFVANGVDIIYPKINAPLFKAILKTGMIVSEYPLKEMPKNYYFPERNRLVAAVSKGLFVSEAGVKSGTAITVSYAVNLGKDIFALPGNADSPMSEMPNRLIKDGAAAVTNADDILSHYENIYSENLAFGKLLQKEEAQNIEITVPESPEEEGYIFPEGKNDEEKILFALSKGPLSIDDISILTKISLEDMNMQLLMMEMNGKIRNDNGIYYLL